ncbi:sialidase family protein [Massilia horti]|uniref:Exo-alpha-sialidase n=1 Tax=Massilia horti TaxID=2562153 RepID=A0A4Y9T6Z4_9BURK|nr:sialidase family protein [Massilia horti]TFW33873.1 exo-alpha-sialidase [Massilia horti]
MTTSIQAIGANLGALLVATCFAAVANPCSAHETAGHGGGHHKSSELATGAALDNSGRLWVVTKETIDNKPFVVLRSSPDMGKTWSEPKPVQHASEPVAANGEARPHVALGPKGELYITYTKPVAPPHVGDIRFVRSLDGGHNFSAPITVHANRDVITHSFESIAVDPAGRIYVSWIDGRGAAAAKARKQSYAGSGVYYAVSSDGGKSFKGDYQIADHSCECCRIGLAINADGKPVAMWRHVFAPNIRDHAVAELGVAGVATPMHRATFDDWRIDACPHAGPSLAFAPDGTRHQVWFSGKEEGGGAFYARADRAGTLAKPVMLGSVQASHADVAVAGKQVVVAWKEFDGNATAIRARVSSDGGLTWREQALARTTGDSDQPRLVASSSRIALVWRTQSDGIQVVPVSTEEP